MKKTWVSCTAACLVVLAPSGAGAFTGDVGDIAVIEDTTGAIHATIMIPPSFCQETAKVFYLSHPDDFDSIVAFTTKNLDFLSNVYQGTPVRNDVEGIGMIVFDQTAAYGSAGRLQNCVKMGKITGLPDDPDVSSPLTYHLTGVEILAHEYSHRWLLWLNYDKNDGLGERDMLRGYEDGANGHWNYYADSRSVMYGNCVTDLGGGSFELAGCPRGYNTLELYAFGLVGPGGVEPVWFVDIGEPHGEPSLPLATGQTAAVAGTKVEVTLDDVMRVHGARVPAVDVSQKLFRVAFVLVSEAGVEAPPDLIAKVDTYRLRFEAWFSTATGGAGSLDTRLRIDETEEDAAEDVIEEETPSDVAAETPDTADIREEEEVLPEGQDAAADDSAQPDGPGEDGGGCACRTVL
jgi:hypothetical protein